MYNDELTLIKQTFIEDEIGNQTPSEVRTTVLCEELSITRNEFYNASTSDYKPVIAFKIHTYEYNNEQIVEYKSERYKVIRTFKIGFEETELTCERVIGV